MKDSKVTEKNTKKVFKKLGTCSQTYFYLLNREFGHPKEIEERASDPFAGGIMQKGHQCGMLWGASLAVGAESFRRFDDYGKATAMAIAATQHLIYSFANRAKNINCRDITNIDLTNKFGILRLILFKARTCLNIAGKWTQEAIQSAKEGLTNEQDDLPKLPISCASEVAKKMGASDEEIVTVAGLAGGLGLSGNACGALGAAIWMKSLASRRNQNGKSAHSNPETKKILKAFYEATDSEVRCDKITGKCFRTIKEHTEFIENGGCEKLINILAQT